MDIDRILDGLELKQRVRVQWRTGKRNRSILGTFLGLADAEGTKLRFADHRGAIVSVETKDAVIFSPEQPLFKEESGEIDAGT